MLGCAWASLASSHVVGLAGRMLVACGGFASAVGLSTRRKRHLCPRVGEAPAPRAIPRAPGPAARAARLPCVCCTTTSRRLRLGAAVGANPGGGLQRVGRCHTICSKSALASARHRHDLAPTAVSARSANLEGWWRASPLLRTPARTGTVETRRRGRPRSTTHIGPAPQGACAPAGCRRLTGAPFV